MNSDRDPNVASREAGLISMKTPFVRAVKERYFDALPGHNHHWVGVYVERLWMGYPVAGQPHQNPRDEPDDHEGEKGTQGLSTLVPEVETLAGALRPHPDKNKSYARYLSFQVVPNDDLSMPPTFKIK